MKARETGMSKARMRSTLESEFQKMFWAMTSIAAAWVRWEMPTARVFSLMFSTSPPSVWNWQSRRKYSGDVLVVGVVLEDVLAVQGLAVAGDRVHAVEVDALADDRERVAGEVEVGHRVDDQVGLGLGVDQGVEGRGRREGHVDLGLGHAGHGLLDELEVVLDGVQLLADDLRHVLAADAGLGDVLVGELGAGAGDLVEHLGDEVLEVEDLHALVPQDLGEGVVLLLRDLQERDVVEQESLELVGRQVEELVAGTVQADAAQAANLARDAERGAGRGRLRGRLGGRGRAWKSRARPKSRATPC